MSPGNFDILFDYATMTYHSLTFFLLRTILLSTFQLKRYRLNVRGFDFITIISYRLFLFITGFLLTALS